MKNFGLIANGAVIPNVTLTMFSHDIDEQQTEEICYRKEITDEAKVSQVRDSVLKRNMQRRVSSEGAEEVRLYPI